MKRSIPSLLIAISLMSMAAVAEAKSSKSNSSSNNTNVGSGNNGNGVGNTGIGNQGNDKPVGNAGGSGDDYQGHHEGNSGNGNGNTGTGNQGNDKPVGNAGGSSDNNGGGDNGGNNGDSSISNSTPTATPSPEFKMKILPLAFGDYDPMIAKVALDRTIPLASRELIQNNTLNLTINETPDGVFVTHTKKYNLTGGLSPLFYIANGTGITKLLWGNIGMAALKNGVITTKSMVKSNDDLSFKDKKIPETATDLQNWKVGDSIYFEHTGGSLLSGNLGLGIAAIGKSKIIEGGWKTFIEKVDNDRALVEIQSTDVENVYDEAGIPLILGTKGNVNELTKGKAFIVDLSDSAAALAFEDMMRMNFVPAESLASESDTIVEVESRLNTYKGKNRNVYVGVPFIYHSFSNGNFLDESTTTKHDDGSVSETVYGIYQKDTKSRVITMHKFTKEAFYAGVLTRKDNKGNLIDSDLTAEFVWKYESDNSDTTKLRNNLREISQKSHIYNINDISIKKYQYLGYVKAELRAKLSLPQIHQLAGEQAGFFQTEVLYNNSLKAINDYFKNGRWSDDPAKLCRAFESPENSFYMEECRDHYIYQLKKDKKALNLAQSLMSTNLVNDNKLFVKQFAKYGEVLLNNHFLLKSMMNDSMLSGLSVEFTVAGEKLPQKTSRETFSIK